MEIKLRSTTSNIMQHSGQMSATCRISQQKPLTNDREGNSSFCFRESQCFPEAQPRETLKFEGNKIKCFPKDQSLSDLFYSTKRKTCNGNINGGRRSTFAGKSALLPSDVRSETFGGKQFYC